MAGENASLGPPCTTHPKTPEEIKLPKIVAPSRKEKDKKNRSAHAGPGCWFHEPDPAPCLPHRRTKKDCHLLSSTTPPQGPVREALCVVFICKHTPPTLFVTGLLLQRPQPTVTRKRLPSRGR